MKKHKKISSIMSKLKKILIKEKPSTHPIGASITDQPKTVKSRGRDSRRISIRVKNKSKIITISSIVIVAVFAAVLTIALNSGVSEVSNKEDLAAVGNGIALPESTPEATIKPEAKASLAMPVYTTVSISEGIEADVVMSLQSCLMALDYMDADEPDKVYDETTKEAVERVQEQHELDVTGVVDAQTYDLLMSGEAQNYIISIGVENTNVQELQQRLYELGYILTVTGYFGTDTEEAVTKFQKLNGLSEDGKVGKQTREMLYSSDAAANSYSYGEESPEIKEFQQRLKKLGYLMTTPDGNFGDDTKAAVRRFQENNGLIADGYIGPSTKMVLLSDDAQDNALAIGNKGDDVTHVQKILKELGYIKKATGYFGSETDTAVRSFQKRNGLSVDGKVGPNTMNVLTSGKAKRSTGASVTGPNVESFISVALSKRGCKYVRGGKGPNTFDCSGFVYWCLNQVGIKQGYMTSRTWASCTKYTKITSMSDMKRGDIIVYSGHVAIYAGDGVMIDASSKNRKIVKRSCTSSWCKDGFICAFRVF